MTPARGGRAAAGALALVAMAAVTVTACGGPSAPAHPTWADVQPILAGECNGCHGAAAADAGAGYRFDFYDMSADVCGDAVAALGAGVPMGQALAPLIWNAISDSPEQPNARPSMPPQPAPYLADWEWQTIHAWLDQKTPKGDLPRGNRPARFRLYRAPDTADASLDVTALVEDPDGDPVVGVLKLGDTTLKMDRAGSFSAHLDTSAWPAGPVTVSAVLCDGWSNVDYAVGTVVIKHAGP